MKDRIAQDFLHQVGIVLDERVAGEHAFLNTRRRSRESTVAFEDYFDQVAAIPDEEPDASLPVSVPAQDDASSYVDGAELQVDGGFRQV